MDKSKRNVLLVIGSFTTAVGIYSLLSEGDFFISLITIVLGLALIGSIFYEKKK